MTAEVAVVAGPGQRLRLAREAAGLSREEVSTRLRLRLELIRALEEDDYAHLPPVAFVSGYLRSYARLLELPAEELVAMLERPDATPALVAPVMPLHQRRSSDWPVKLVTWLIVLLLLGLLAVWWLSRQPAEDEPAGEPAMLQAPDGNVSLTLPPVTETPPQAEPQEVAVAEPSPVIGAAPPVPVPLQVTEVQLEAGGGDCWLEVKDADGKQLVYELLQDGMTRTVRGKAPFEIFLGNAPAVTVYYQGKVFDHAPFQRREVARFRLGKAADNQPIAE
ncbi:RodZ domain-containing protein [Sulfurivermis fontis]|uniref:RodZ domain-containing protein n=1 Tax=Sulfurivermis fontis TaxID=1972068 RepID=UPI0015591C97|nr:RodZ domain-containing protein [Sulfurivermis fontis]